MLTMRQVNGQTVITWQIDGDGTVAGARPATVQGASGAAKWDSRQLTINYAGTGQLHLQNNTVLVGQINAPNARVLATGAEVYGSVVGNAIDMNASSIIHFDRQLSATPPTTYTVGADRLTSFSWKK